MSFAAHPYPQARSFRARIGFVAVIVLASFAARAALGQTTTTYNGTNGGNWSTAANWSAGVPTTGNTAALPALFSSYTLNFDGNYPTTPPNGFITLTIDGGVFQIGPLHQLTTSALSQTQANTSMGCGEELIGDTGAGLAVYNQSAGTNTTLNFVLGFGANSNGIYNLSANASLTGISSDCFVGYSGNGTFNQSGTSTVAVTGLTVGAQAGSSGSYTLSGGTLTLAASNSQLAIGSQGSGMFVQSAGAVTTHSLFMGTGSTGSGTYKLGGSGSLTVTNGREEIGTNGHAEFDQTGGTNTATLPIMIVNSAGTGQGVYNLQGGTVSAQSIQINPGGTLNQTGGTITASTPVQLSGGTITGTLQNLGTFHYSSGTFSGRLLNQGAVTFDADFAAGNGIENDTLLMVPSGLTMTLGGAGLDNRGTLTLAGGTLVLSTAAAAANTNSGTFNLNSAQGFHLLAASITNTGTLNLNGSFLDGTGTLTNAAGGTIAGYGVISSPLNNSGGTLLVQGGTLKVSGAFTNGGAIQLAGGTLSGGDVANAGAIRGAGAVNSSVNNTGTIEPVSGTLLFNGPINNNSGGTIDAATGNQIVFAPGLASNAGTINLSGGIFDNNNHPLNNTGTLIGFGTLRTGGLTNNGNITFSGGSTSVAGDVTNAPAHTLTVEYTPAIFTGNVTNNGTIKITKTTATFAGTFTNNGTYNSDPAENRFSDLHVGSDGALVGGQGDRFVITGDLINSSTNKTGWNTGEAELAFTGGNVHHLVLAGIDRGATDAGYNNNFAFGVLSLGAGDSLVLDSADAGSRSALYVRELSLAGGIAQLDSIASGGINVYYDPSAAGSSYLGDQSYELSGGGFVAPVPEPRAVVWLGATLSLFRRRRHARQGLTDGF